MKIAYVEVVVEATAFILNLFTFTFSSSVGVGKGGAARLSHLDITYGNISIGTVTSS